MDKPVTILTMRIIAKCSAVLSLIFFIAYQASAQTTELSFISSNYFDKIAAKLKSIGQQLDKKTESYLHKIEKQEERLYKKLWENFCLEIFLIPINN